MDAAIAKILSDDIDIDDDEKLDFAEAESGSDAEEEGDDDGASEQEEGSPEEEEDGAAAGDDDEEDEEQNELDADLGGAESDEEGGLLAGSESSDSGASDDAEAGAAPELRRGFLEGGKADTFARAFTRIMEDPKAAGAADAPILMGSKSVAKRKAEGEEATKADRAAKRLRLEMRVRGHAVPARRGEDPAADAREKALQRVATRGVVRLFNAVSKAQRRLKDAEVATGSKGRAAKLGKASFLAELRSARAAPGGEGLVPSAKVAEGGEANAGWDVLKDGFTGLAGSSKMKDWDRRPEEEDVPEEAGGGEGSDGEDSDGDAGW